MMLVNRHKYHSVSFPFFFFLIFSFITEKKQLSADRWKLPHYAQLIRITTAPCYAILIREGIG
jgi:hypothetical protein